MATMNDKDLEECQREYQNGGVQGCKNFLRRKADEWKTVPLNVGIIGNSGTGKSTFINSIRGLTADDEGAAAVGETETTTVPTPFPHPVNQLLKFWDLPGVGTPKFPKESYLNNIGFETFDIFVIIHKDRFDANDLWIARKIAETKKLFYFVRSKIHSSIADDKSSHPRTHNRDRLLAKIRDDIRKNLRDLYREDAVFLIDSHHRHEYDFNRLEKKLIDDLPSNKKKAFALSMRANSDIMVGKKVEILREDIWVTALLSAVGAVGAIPLPTTPISETFDLVLVINRNKFYFEQLGLDEKSLAETAQSMSCDIGRLTEIVENDRKAYITEEGFTGEIQKSSQASISSFAKKLLRAVPIVGSVDAYKTMGATLNEMLNRLEKTAIKVVKVALEAAALAMVEEN